MCRFRILDLTGPLPLLRTQEYGGMVTDREGVLVALEESELLQHIGEDLLNLGADIQEDWFVPVDDVIVQEMIGEGQFGTVHMARWRGTPIVAKVGMGKQCHIK